MSTPSEILIDALGPGSTATALRHCAEPTLAATLALAAQERLSAALGWRVIRLGWVEAPPLGMAELIHTRALDPWTRLAASAVVNAARNADLAGQLRAIAASLDGAGVEWFPLKGAALLEAGAWPDPGARAMTDLDLWVPEQPARATAVLADLGYRSVAADYRGHHHLPPMMLPGHPGSVEVHTRLVPDRYAHLLPSAPILARARPCHVHDGTVGRGRLAPKDLIRHLVVHDRLTDRTLVGSRLGLRAVLDVGYLWSAQPVGSLTEPHDARALTAALAAHLAGVHAVFGAGPNPSARAERWWRRACWLADEPRRAWWWRQLMDAPSMVKRGALGGWRDYRRSGWPGLTSYAKSAQARVHERARNRPRLHGA